MHLVTFLGLLHESEKTLASSYRTVAEGHVADVDVYYTCSELAKQCDAHEQSLAPVLERYGESTVTEPERLQAAGLSETRSGSAGMLRDLQDLYLLASFVQITWTLIGQAAQGLRDRELLDIVTHCESQTVIQIKWLRTRMKQAAPQALLVAS